MGMSMVRAASAIPSGFVAAVLEVWLFYRPGRALGVIQRLFKLVFAGTMLFTGLSLLAFGTGLYAGPAVPTGQDRAIFMGMFVGYVVGGGWFISRRRQRAKAISTPAPVRPNPLAPVSDGGHGRTGSGSRRARLTVAYFVGMLFCSAGIAAGASLGLALQSDLEQRGVSLLVVFALVHLGTFLYSQLLSGRALNGLQLAVRDDWRVGRRGQFLLGGGALLWAIPQSATVSPGTAAGLGVQLVALWLGYRWTDLPPSGTLRTLRALLAARQDRRPGLAAPSRIAGS